MVAIGQGALMVLGGALALLVAQVFGKNAKTDAFFTAYGIYAVGLTFAQTFRLTAVSRLIQGDENESVTHMLGAVTLMALGLGIPMLVLANPVAKLLVTTDPGHIGPTTLRILWLALTAQLLAAMLATVLAVRAAFFVIGLAMLLSGLISVGVFLATYSALGIISAPVALAASALWLSTVFGVTLRRRGWRPMRPDLRAARRMSREASTLTVASAFFIGTNLAYVVCVSIAARQGKGEATLFAYAYVLAVALVAVTANVSAMVHSPALIASSSRAAGAAATGVSTLRFTLMLAGPVLGMALLVGRPLIGLALGHGFSSGDVREILVTLVLLTGWLLASAAGLFAVIELLARSELRKLVWLGAMLILGAFALALVGSVLAGVEGIAAGLSVAMIGVTIAQLRWAFGGEWLACGGEMLSDTARELAVVVVSFAPAGALLLAFGTSTVMRVAAGVLAAGLVAVASRIAWPEECRAILAVISRSSQPAGGLRREEVETAAV